MARGGKRTGAGRKSRYGVETTTVRIPAALKEEVLAFVERRMTERARDSETVTESNTIEAWKHSNRRCQAATTKDTRCSNASSIIEVDRLPDGRKIEYEVCKRHHTAFTRGDPVRPHRSILKP
ncbi:hypothetical protein [Methylohalobius crimeensis]|uniref:hypothetical protein n=1 Tax=Methylohalobius crimeensis TaxID=244365 RepID=UPI0003B5D7F0|nr:hypothetical protein [Methylohalobius crimeensis]